MISRIFKVRQPGMVLTYFRTLFLFNEITLMTQRVSTFQSSTGVDLASSTRRGVGSPWGGARPSLTGHSPLQSATLLSQHYYCLRWPNLHVRRSVKLHYILFIKFILAIYLVCVTGQLLQHSKFAKVQYSKFAC